MATPIEYLKDAISVALGAGYAIEVRKVCAEIIDLIDRHTPEDIHTAPTLRSIDITGR